MIRVFLRKDGFYNRGDAPDRPPWFWQGREHVTASLEEVVSAGLDALEKTKKMPDMNSLNRTLQRKQRRA